MRQTEAALSAGTPRRASVLHSATVIGLVVVGGLIMGAMLGAATEFVSRSEIAGGRFRGNGALFVPFVVGPFLLAAGWTMLALWHRGDRRWPWGGLVVVLLAVLLAAVAGFVLPDIYEAAGAEWGMVTQFLMLTAVPLVAGLGLAALFARLTRRGLVAALALALLMPAMQVLPGLVFAQTEEAGGGNPLGIVVIMLFSVLHVLQPALVLVTPLLAAPPTPESRRWGAGWLAGGFLVLLVAVVAGMVGTGRLLGGG